MDRRTAIRTLATASALPMLAPDEVSGLLEMRRTIDGASSHAAPRALGRREFDIVGAVADIVLPPTETPGATDLGVPAFVDLIVAEWMEGDDARELTEGLLAMDREAAVRFDRGFLEATAEQQLALVRELDDRLPEPGSVGEVPDNFYRTLKRLILVGYFTTEEGASQTGYRITPGAFGGCVAPGGDA